MRGHVQADLEARAHRRPELVRPFAYELRVDRRGLGARDDVAHLDEGRRVGHAHRCDLGAEVLEHLRRGADARGHLGVQPLEVVVLGQADAQALDRRVEHPLVVRHAPPARRGVERVVAGDRAE